MYKIWKPTDYKSDKVILIYEKSIYKGNPSNEDIRMLSTEKVDLKILKKLFPIPFSYIKKIINQEDINHIKVYFGRNSEEELNVSNIKLKNEIFDYLKNEIPELKYESKIPSSYKYAKPQIFGILITTGIFIWAMYFAVQMSNGYEYELVGGNPGLSGIVLAIAHFGITKLIIGYSAILIVGMFSLIKRLKTRTEMQILER